MGEFNFDAENPYLFEISWEVANRVGGIYTVIKTKTGMTVDEFGERYSLIGPYVPQKALLEVERTEPSCPFTMRAIGAMRAAGVNVVHGKWLVDGSPNVILFDLGSVAGRLNEWKADVWEKATIPSPAGDTETNDAVLFGYCVAWFLGEFCFQQKKVPIIAHFHEWLAGVGAILCRKRGIKVATIFTTHATLLGRYLCAGNADFYNHLKFFNVDTEAGKRCIYHRYCLERAAAHCADVFTTVSHITAYEAEYLLKRKPDGVLPNGLNGNKFSTMHEMHNLHNENKEKIKSFVQGHFYGHCDFDLDNTLYFFTAGRYEYRNKGVDLFLESLARLNWHLKQSNSATTVVAFIIMPAATANYNVEALKGQAVTKQLKDVVSRITESIGSRVYEKALRGALVESNEVISDEEIVALKRHMLALKRDTLPPIVTHNMVEGGADPILMELRRLHLFNSPSDRVKIVFHPEFLSANNPVLGIDYEDFVRGCHLGVFPSYYEPWGYTPAECTMMGIPSVTTNLSGFGCYIEENVENPADYGIYIVDRRMKSVEESVQQLTEQFLHFCQKSRRQRINLRNRTERLGGLLDWKKLGQDYIKARHLALHRAYPEHFADLNEYSAAAGIEVEMNPGAAPEELNKIPRPASAIAVKESFSEDENSPTRDEEIKCSAELVCPAPIHIDDVPMVNLESFSKLNLLDSGTEAVVISEGTN